MRVGKLKVLPAIVSFSICASLAGAQTADPKSTIPVQNAPMGATSKQSVPLKPEELEQIAAPIALYPDSLLAQIFMASTYPLEVVQADRWVKANPTLAGSPEALNKLTWDPSVKSLINFPQVLTMMSEKLDWTVKLGDAFIADQKAIMDAVQRLRSKAQAQGNLKTNEEQKVTVQPATAPAAQGSSSSQVIVIESSSPSTVYVPTYNPAVVYGGWPYPSYPPYYYYPPNYVAGAAFVSFGVGVAVGAAWGHAWGGCDWNHGDVDIDIDRNVNFNRNINREQYKAEFNNRSVDRGGTRNAFQHDPAHRQGVGYRDTATSERYRGSGASQATAQARNSYRGRAETGRTELNRGAANQYRGAGATGSRTNSYGQPAQRSYNSQSAQRAYNTSGSRANGFSGSDGSGASARAASNRGQVSRSSSPSGGSRVYSSNSGGGRSSGGAARSGGGGGSRGGGGGGSRGGGRR